MPDQRTPLRMCNTVSGEGEQTEPLVHCPVEGASMPLAHCASCSRLRTMEWSLGAGALFCRTDEGVPRTDRRADLAEVAARAPLHMMLERDTTCVTADVGVIEVKQLMAERGLRSVAVVDAAHRLVGIVSQRDLMTVGNVGRVGDVMTAHVHALPEEAPVGYAVALMAFENVSEVPVVSQDGRVLGMYRALDALRWLAGQLGYVAIAGANPPRRD